MSKLTSFFASFGRLSKVKTLCDREQRGVYKRIDENRELLELLQRESPDLLQQCPWIEGWLDSQDRFLSQLAAIVGTDNRLGRLDGNFPRPWPGAKTMGRR
ncbi:hypothetical protein [Citrobacter koseri]|uniref:hypothetical protein n=1 Tax=Citrobacter koseri TaxID=545 RepID=UPI002953863D|nr:hypothetical protein [Citrobacter koseri]WOP85256.1 hypothetical protein R0291_22300 [Citrobacter koseri]